MQTSIREWALRQGWGGRPVRQESAQGILVAALGVLCEALRHPRRGAPVCLRRIVTCGSWERGMARTRRMVVAIPPPLLLKEEQSCPAREKW